MASYTSATAAEDEISQFITDGGHDASVTPVSEQAGNLAGKKRKVNQDSEVSAFRPMSSFAVLTHLSDSQEAQGSGESRYIRHEPASRH
jgi:hypothetical protein